MNAPISLLLRDPGEVARRCMSEEGLKPLTLASITALVLGSTVFGAVVGSFRGHEQIAFAAAKVPLASLLALAICAPAFHGIAAALGRPRPLRTIIALTMAAAGRGALVLLAFSPILWLAYDLGLGYHAAALAAAGAYMLSGLAALSVLVRGLDEGPHRWTTALAFVLVFFAAGGQMSWILRPYLVRPATEDVPFLRDVEGGFADAIYHSSRSMIGLYDRAEEEWDETSHNQYSVEPEWMAPEANRARYDDPYAQQPAYDDPYLDDPAPVGELEESMASERVAE